MRINILLNIQEPTIRSDYLKTRIILAVILAALMMMLFTFLTSTSWNGVVLGRWSVPVSLISVILLVACGFVIRFLVGSKGVIESGNVRLSSCPDFLPSLLLVVFLPLFFVLWFLFPIPLLQRTSFTFGVVLLTVSSVLLIIGSYTEKRRRSTILGTVIMMVALLTALLISEFVLRKLMPPSIFNPRFGLRPYRRVELEVNLPGITPGGIWTTNAWGMRGEDPPADWDEWFTIVTVGGSTTADYYIDDSLTWSWIIQDRLREVHPRTWVGNCGIPRHSTAEHALLVREVLSEVKPDIALFLVGINDVGQFLRGEDALNVSLPETGLRQAIFKHCMLMQVLYKLKIVYVDKAPVLSEAVDPMFIEEPLLSPERELPDDLHELIPQPDDYRNRIEAIILECRKFDITPVFMTQPLLYEDNDYWRGRKGGSYWFGGTDSEFSAASYWLILNTLNNDLIEVCEKEGVAYLDLASLIPHSRGVFYDSMHLTEYGAALVGEVAADYLIEELIIEQEQ
ncbi:MAG: SGNH/GDSL hydrolase family protein [Candidatus Aegiribacteria sp.]|nr:SGNH/GDSL hydrolase family protein [Candidatus Aegiribacteria sp.]